MCGVCVDMRSVDMRNTHVRNVRVCARGMWNVRNVECVSAFVCAESLSSSLFMQLLFMHLFRSARNPVLTWFGFYWFADYSSPVRIYRVLCGLFRRICGLFIVCADFLDVVRITPYVCGFFDVRVDENHVI